MRIKESLFRLLATASTLFVFVSPFAVAENNPSLDAANKPISIYPERPQDALSDFTHTLSRADYERINQRLKSIDLQLGIQVFAALVGSVGADGIDQYGNLLFKKWAIGDAKKNNGLLLVIAKEDRKMRIEVGYGLEGDLTDIKTKIISRENIIPKLKENNFAGAIDGFIDGINPILAALPNDAQKSDFNQLKSLQKLTDFNSEVFGLVIVFFMLVIGVKLGVHDLLLQLARKQLESAKNKFKEFKRDFCRWGWMSLVLAPIHPIDF